MNFAEPDGEFAAFRCAMQFLDASKLLPAAYVNMQRLQLPMKAIQRAVS
jgi:hypothetical protein